MIKAGAPVDEMLDKLLPLLEPGDVVIDGGNSWFKDTQLRATRLLEHDLHFVGSGVSGGEDGARFGPSLMPGGTRESWESIRAIFEAIAARSDSGPCVTYCGPDGAGHFVKMVHNGIEYGDMQLIAEAYDLLRRGLGLDADATRGHLRRMEPRSAAVVPHRDHREDLPQARSRDRRAARRQGSRQGGTEGNRQVDRAGRARSGRADPDHRRRHRRARAVVDEERARRRAARCSPASRRSRPANAQQFISDVHDALYAAKICSYAQGFALMQAGSREWNWNIDLREIARIWKAGCIIRAKFLDSIMRAYERRADLPNLLLDDAFREDLGKSHDAWRRAVTYAQSNGIAAPAFAASLAYFDSYRTANLPQNLTQAQRDFFGAHTYQRNDTGEDAAVRA